MMTMPQNPAKVKLGNHTATRPLVSSFSGRRPVKVITRPAVSKFDDVAQAPPDLVLGITEAFKADTHPDKLNLGVGAYRDEDLKPYVLEVVRKAEEKILASNLDHEYLAIQGLPGFLKATIDLLLGNDFDKDRVACLQALSGTGSLTIGAHLINQYLPGATVYISDPTWPNHKNIFTLAGVKWANYRYFNPETVGLNFDGMIEDIKTAPTGSVILLHGCAHNPTGIDPTKEQWATIADVIEEKGHIAFFDVAYQGFATGSLEEDSFAPRYFASRGLEFLVAQSYSKNLGLYGERVGAISVVTGSKDAATRVMSQLKRLARAVWSNPPAYGARIVESVVNDESMFNEWKGEMEMMSGRIKAVRQVLYDHLVRLNPDKDWKFILEQIGMFSFTGMSPAQVENMTNKWHIYMTKDGRISLAGLNKAKSEYLAKAIDDSVRNC